MVSLVVPFRGTDGKTRLRPLAADMRSKLVHAMLADVLIACTEVGATVVVGAVDFAPTGVVIVDDPGGGQGAAVAAGLTAAREICRSGPYLVVNADLPCVRAADLRALAGAVPSLGLALVSAHDGTTNALGLSQPERFRPLYGPGSATRFSALPGARRVICPNLADDVDTPADLDRVADRLGACSSAVVRALRSGAGG